MEKAFVCECGCMIFTLNEGLNECTCTVCSNKYKVQHTINRDLLIIEIELWLYRWDKKEHKYKCHAEKVMTW